MGRPWFKHFANASEGTLNILIASRNQDAVFLYWIILEILCRLEASDTPGQLALPWSVLSKRSGYLIPKLRKTYAKLISISLIRDLGQNEMGFKLEVPKWLELQSPWGGKREARFDQDAGRSKKIEKRNKKVDIEIEGTPPSAKPTLPLLIEIWNRESGALPKAKGSSPKRTAAAKARFTEHPDEGYWVTVVQKIAASDFCRGVSETGWIAGVDFLLKPDTHLKVMEGKYDNRTGPVKPPESDSMRASREYIERLERESREILG